LREETDLAVMPTRFNVAIMMLVAAPQLCLALVGGRAPVARQHVQRATAAPGMQQKLASAFAALLVSVPSFPVASALAYSDPPPLVVAAPTSSQPDGGLDATTTAVADAGAAKTPSRKYINFTGFPFPLGPFFERTTVATELVPNRVYSFEQTLDLGGIEANVRSLAFRMRDNHLLVYNPVAPTDEFMQQLASHPPRSYPVYAPPHACLLPTHTLLIVWWCHFTELQPLSHTHHLHRHPVGTTSTPTDALARPPTSPRPLCARSANTLRPLCACAIVRTRRAQDLRRTVCAQVP
jgi:hypothetical protein